MMIDFELLLQNIIAFLLTNKQLNCMICNMFYVTLILAYVNFLIYVAFSSLVKMTEALC